MIRESKKMGLKMELDWDTADRITLLSLICSRKTAFNQLRNYQKDPKKNWMHPDDVANTPIQIAHLDAVIKYYGGDFA